MQDIRYYIALIGKNPLPIYIAGLNYIEGNTKTCFIYTEEKPHESISSKEVAKNIEESLKRKISCQNDINLIGCAKNSCRDINKVLDDIWKKIRIDSENHDNHVTVYADYTGATKMMAASMYRFFKEKSIEDKGCSNISYKAVYVSADKNEVYESSFIHDGYENGIFFSNDLIAEKYKVDSNDILNLHGWRMKNDGIIVSSYGYESKKIDRIDNDGFTLKMGFAIDCKKISSLVDEYFYIDDLCKKAGGTTTKITIRIKGIEEPDLEDEFYNRVRNITNIGIKDRVRLIKEGDQYE